MFCTGPCGVENINTEPDKLTTDAEGSLLPNKIYTAVVLEPVYDLLSSNARKAR